MASARQETYRFCCFAYDGLLLCDMWYSGLFLTWDKRVGVYFVTDRGKNILWEPKENGKWCGKKTLKGSQKFWFIIVSFAHSGKKLNLSCKSSGRKTAARPKRNHFTWRISKSITLRNKRLNVESVPAPPVWPPSSPPSAPENTDPPSGTLRPLKRPLQFHNIIICALRGVCVCVREQTTTNNQILRHTQKKLVKHHSDFIQYKP